MDFNDKGTFLNVPPQCFDNSGVIAAFTAPAADTTAASAVSQRLHVRTKRCSCATFLDKERVVSYGMGNAPRTRRAAPDSMATSSRARCRCASESDTACRNFCLLEHDPRYETSTDSAEGDGCAEAQCKHKLAADTGRIKRLKGNNKKRVLPLLLKAALKTRLLLEKWRVRQHHRARAQPPKDER